MPRKGGSVWRRQSPNRPSGGLPNPPPTPYNTHKRDTPAPSHRLMLTGSALLSTFDAMKAEGKKPSEIAIACGYCTVEGSNTKIHFTDFYTAILEERGTIQKQEPEEIEAEDSDNQETINDLLEDYPADAIRAFIELYGEDNLEHFIDSYQGEMTGAEFAEQLVSDCYCLDIPAFVSIDWEDTWEGLRYDYTEEDGYIFAEHF